MIRFEVPDQRRAVIVSWPGWEFRWILNWPTFSLLSREVWRYTPDIDPRKSLSRTRIGPVKVEVVRW